MQLLKFPRFSRNIHLEPLLGNYFPFVVVPKLNLLYPPRISPYVAHRMSCSFTNSNIIITSSTLLASTTLYFQFQSTIMPTLFLDLTLPMYRLKTESVLLIMVSTISIDLLVSVQYYKFQNKPCSHKLSSLPTPIYQDVGMLAHFSLHPSANVTVLALHYTRAIQHITYKHTSNNLPLIQSYHLSHVIKIWQTVGCLTQPSSFNPV